MRRRARIRFLPESRLRLASACERRVCRGIYALQLRYVVVGIYLRGLERRVAHQLLYLAQVGAVVEQVGANVCLSTCGEHLPFTPHSRSSRPTLR